MTSKENRRSQKHQEGEGLRFFRSSKALVLSGSRAAKLGQAEHDRSCADDPGLRMRLEGEGFTAQALKIKPPAQKYPLHEEK